MNKPRVTNKLKILNDPVYGFISFPNETVFDLVNHPWFQRLRRIKQLGMSHLVYPGAVHSRFNHVIGAMHLMTIAVDVLRGKGVEISNEEECGAVYAILLHDIGHGPFSHTLEHSIVPRLHHEEISLMFMNRLNEELNGELDLAIKIFKGEYEKKFLHQLVSSQLDMDRLDYLKRDSFYTGVTEGEVGSDRIITMLNVYNDELVMDEKGIYSIENFLVARRFMYWQVYLHKTVVAAEQVMIQTLRRARELALNGKELYCGPHFREFLYNDVAPEDFKNDPRFLDTFAMMDDYDILSAMKTWTEHSDKVLADLSRRIINRNLFKIRISKVPFDQESVVDIKQNVAEKFGYTTEEAEYFVVSDILTNNAYSQKMDNINLLFKDGTIMDIAEASDNLNILALSDPVNKHFVAFAE